MMTKSGVYVCVWVCVCVCVCVFCVAPARVRVCARACLFVATIGFNTHKAPYMPSHLTLSRLLALASSGDGDAMRQLLEDSRACDVNLGSGYVRSQPLLLLLPLLSVCWRVMCV
jgi:hypothetical protein